MEDNTEAPVTRTQEILRSFSHLLILVGLYFVFAVMFQLLGFLIGQWLSGEELIPDLERLVLVLDNENKVFGHKIAQLIGSLGGFAVTALVYTRFILKEDLKEYFGFRGVVPPARQMGLIVLIGISAIPVLSALISLNQMVELPEEMVGQAEQLQKNYNNLATAFLRADTLDVLLFNFLLIAIVPALGEELFFRGAMMQSLYRLFSNRIHIAVFVSAFLFSFIHFEPFSFLPILFIGVIFGYMYYWSGNIVVTIWAHFLNNGMAVLLAYLYQRNPGTEWLAYEYEFPMWMAGVSAVVFIGALYLFYKTTRPYHAEP